jgi:adenylylsulfate kinase
MRSSKVKKVIWFTGLSGSGKTTLSKKLISLLLSHNLKVIYLDGDEMRKGVSSDLSYSSKDRFENIRRVAELSKLLMNQSDYVIVSTISPTHKLRSLARKIIGNQNFILIYLSTPIHVCIKRDPKGFYAKSIKGELRDFTGISSPFEVPINFDLAIDTSKINEKNALMALMNFLNISQPSSNNQTN